MDQQQSMASGGAAQQTTIVWISCVHSSFLVLMVYPSAAQERDQLELERQQANLEKLQLDTEVTEKGS